MKYIVISFLFSSILFSQKKYPQDYFRSPLDISMQLSGNFGELRPNHFHAGFDFKTKQKEGLNVYAVADGYVSRIKISTAGYGKAIYINHANGYTSVYGHLQKAIGAIQDKIIEKQYSEKEYEIELFFKPNELTVKKGDIIALSGNTGGSEGPHLHFEFRDTATEEVLNPLLFGYGSEIKDTKKPVVSSLVVYPIDNESIANQSKRPVNINVSLQSDGTYLADKIYASGKLGFGVTSFDEDNVSYNNNGVYKTQLAENGKIIFGYEFDKMVFDEARYVNTFIDYPRYKTMRQRVQKLFFKNFYSLSNIKNSINNGIINVVPSYSQLLRLETSDFNDNKTIISIPVEYSVKQALVQKETKETPFFVKTSRESIFEKENISVFFPVNAFYDDFYMNFNVKDNIVTVHEDVIPVHNSFTISIEDTKSSVEEKKKMFIAAINGNKMSYYTTKLSGNTFSCKSKTLGKYTLTRDTTPPKINVSKSIENKDLTKQKSITFTISDDLAGVKSFDGYLNDKWVLFEYEPKLKKITHTFVDEKMNEGLNSLKIIVNDNVGNTTTFQTQFNRSQKK